MPLRIWGSVCSVVKNCKYGRDDLHLLLGTLFFFAVETNYLCFLHWIISMIPESFDESELWKSIEKLTSLFTAYSDLSELTPPQKREQNFHLDFSLFILLSIPLENLSLTISLWLLTSWHCLLCRDDVSLVSPALISSAKISEATGITFWGIYFIYLAFGLKLNVLLENTLYYCRG